MTGIKQVYRYIIYIYYWSGSIIPLSRGYFLKPVVTVSELFKPDGTPTHTKNTYAQPTTHSQTHIYLHVQREGILILL